MRDLAACLRLRCRVGPGLTGHLRTALTAARGAAQGHRRIALFPGVLIVLDPWLFAKAILTFLAKLGLFGGGGAFLEMI